MSLIAKAQPSWNAQSLKALHEKYKADWHYPKSSFDKLMLADELTGIEMSRDMLRELADPYRWRETTDYENGGSTVPASAVYGEYLEVGVLRSSGQTFTHHPMNAADLRQALAVVNEIQRSGLHGYTLQLVKSAPDSLDSAFELHKGDEVLGTVTAQSVYTALDELSDRNLVFTRCLGVARPSVQRVIQRDSWGWEMIDETGKRTDGRGSDARLDLIAKAVAELRATQDGGLLKVQDPETAQVSVEHIDQASVRTVCKLFKSYYIEDEHGDRQKTEFETEAEAVGEANAQLAKIGGYLQLLDGTEVHVPRAAN